MQAQDGRGDPGPGALTEAPSGLPEAPDDYAVSAREALRAADADPEIRARKAELADRAGSGKGGGREELTAAVEAEPVRIWEVGYFDGDEKVNLVIVDAVSGEVSESFTGSAVSWPMARGREGQFGHVLNAPWVWIPLAAVFLAGLFNLRRPLQWVHLDLLVLLSFGISQAFFNAAEIGVSVPLYYPPLLYLLARMLWIGFRGGGRGGLRPSAPPWLLMALVVALVVLRITANVVDSGVIDVGYAGVIGADRITSAEPIYGEGSFPEDNPTGDTYGPANYYAYVLFEQALPWSGTWDELPAAHAAAIFFDLLTVLGLFALGRTLVRRDGDRGDDEDGGEGADAAAAIDPTGVPASRLSLVRRARLRARRASNSPANAAGVTLAFAWVAYPYTAFALQSNSNDALLSAALVWSLVLFANPSARGGLLAAAALTKFAPLALAPLYAAGERGLSPRALLGSARRPALRPLLLFAAAFVAGSLLLLAHPLVDPGLAGFYERTIGSQAERVSPFSIWGQADLEWLHTVVKLGALGLAVLVAFVPRRRTLPQIAALGAAVIIAVQLTAEHWFYLYIPWFLPLLLAALLPSAENPPDPATARLGSAP